MTTSAAALELISLSEAARMLGLSGHWTVQLWDMGRLHGIRVGGRRLVYKSSVEDLKRERSAGKAKRRKR